MKRFIISLAFCLPLIALAQVRPDSVRKYRDLSIKYMRLSEKATDTSLQRKYYDSSQHYIRLHHFYFEQFDLDGMQKRRDSINRKRQ